MATVHQGQLQLNTSSTTTTNRIPRTRGWNMGLLNDPAVDPSIQTSSRQENCPLILRIAQENSGRNKVRHFEQVITHTLFSTSRTTWEENSSSKPIYNRPLGDTSSSENPLTRYCLVCACVRFVDLKMFNQVSGKKQPKFPRALIVI